MIKTLIISPSQISSDPRVLRHILAAKEFGPVVTCGYGVAPHDVVQHFQIPPHSRYISRSIVNLTAIQFGLHQFAARRTQFYKQATQMLDDQEFDVVIGNDVHSIQTVVDLFHPSRVWIDMHEYAPLESEHDWRWRIAYRRHIRYLCNSHLPYVNTVTSVGKKICQRYEQELHRPVLQVRNASAFERRVERYKSGIGPIRCVHVGASIRARHLEKLIIAVGACPSHITLDLFLIPTDGRYHNELLELVERFTNIKMNDAVPHEQLIETISQFDVGCVSIPPTSYNYAHCLPNKFFQYIQARLPIISGPIPEVAELVEEMKIGWISKGFGSEETKNLLLSIDHEMIRKLEQNLDSAALRLSSKTDNEVRQLIIKNIASKN